jgi:type IV fimbrial biogenesis protein FimT
MLIARRQRGFNLVELAVTLVVVSILLGLAAPSFTAWVRNQRLRTVAEALQSGLRLAQSEAVRRNRQVVFSLTNQVPGLDSQAVVNGSAWAIHTVPLMVGEDREFVQGGPLGDVTDGVTITGEAATCFNSAGRQTPNADPGVGGAPCVVELLRRFDVSRQAAVEGVDRPLQIAVSIGGQVRMCDPARALADSADGCAAP